MTMMHVISNRNIFSVNFSSDSTSKWWYDWADGAYVWCTFFLTECMIGIVSKTSTYFMHIYIKNMVDPPQMSINLKGARDRYTLHS